MIAYPRGRHRHRPRPRWGAAWLVGVLYVGTAVLWAGLANG